MVLLTLSSAAIADNDADGTSCRIRTATRAFAGAIRRGNPCDHRVWCETLLVNAVVVDLLERPVYGFRQADRVLGLGAGTTARWVDGYTRGKRAYEPVVRERPTGDELVTWGEFVEVRLLAEFRDAQVPMVRLRPTVERLRQELGGKYPLAHAETWLDVKAREVVRRAQEDVRLKDQFTVVRNGQEQIGLSPQSQVFVDAVTWDGSAHGVALSLCPLPDIPQVVCDPQRQVGEPIINGVMVDILTEQFRVGEPPDGIAELFGLSIDDVMTAVRYELVRAGRETEPTAA